MSMQKEYSETYKCYHCKRTQTGSVIKERETCQNGEWKVTDEIPPDCWLRIGGGRTMRFSDGKINHFDGTYLCESCASDPEIVRNSKKKHLKNIIITWFVGVPLVVVILYACAQLGN